MGHTKLPWRWNEQDQLVSTHGAPDYDGDIIYPLIIEMDSGFYPPRAPDRAFIVLACNAHNPLIDALQRLLADHRTMDPHHQDVCELCLDADEALRMAGVLPDGGRRN
jgi:hypothetical protein